MIAVWMFATAASAGWRDDAAAARAACSTAPAPCEVVDGLFLRVDRAGRTVAQDPRLAGAEAALLPLVLDRLLREREPAVRAGLADAARELLSAAADAGDDRWDAAWIDLVSDPQPEVRAVLVDGLRRAPLRVAQPALRAAAGHGDPSTRADAARNMGGHAELPALVPDLVALASDPDPAVRAQVARALGRAAGRGPLPEAARAALSRLAVDPDARTRGLAPEALSGG